MKYQNFDISVLPGKTSTQYLLFASSPTQGEVAARMEIDFAKEELQVWLKAFEQQNISAAQLKEFGNWLFEKLYCPEIRQFYERCLGETLDQPESGLRIRLRIEPPEISALPWEFLYSPSRQLFLATSHETHLVRYLNLPGPIGKMEIPGLIRALIIIPELWGLNADLEKAILQKAFTNLSQSLTANYLEGQVTPARLREALRQQEYHLIHYIGHGQATPEGAYLFLNDENGAPWKLSDEQFGAFFRARQSVKLAVLNACQGGKQLSRDTFAGVAQQLVKHGLPAVVAMQAAINDDDAILFAQEFYGELCGRKHGGMVDFAISRARNALWQDSKQASVFAVPVLFMRSLDGGRLWQPVAKEKKSSFDSKNLWRTMPFVGLVLILILLVSLNKEQSVVIRAVSKNFSFRCAPKDVSMLFKSLAVDSVYLSHFASFSLLIQHCTNLSKDQVLLPDSGIPSQASISPEHALFSGAFLRGHELALKNLRATRGLILRASIAEDFNVTFDLFNHTEPLEIQLGHALRVTLQDCSFKIYGPQTSQQYRISNQESFFITCDTSNSILKIPSSQATLTTSFFLPPASFERAETLLDAELSADSIDFTKSEIDKIFPVSTLTKLAINLPDMGNKLIYSDSSASIYLKVSAGARWTVKSLELHPHAQGFQIHLVGESSRVEIGGTLDDMRNVMPSILEWLWGQQKIALIVSCLLWIVATFIAIKQLTIKQR